MLICFAKSVYHGFFCISIIKRLIFVILSEAKNLSNGSVSVLYFT